MLLKIQEPKIISDVIGIISELVTEVKIRVDKLGMKIVAIDPANVALVNFRIPSSQFSQIEVDEEVIGVNLDNLKSVLRRCSASSALILKTEENNLNIEIQDKVRRNFSLALIDIEQEEKEVPNLSFTTRVEMSSSGFSESIEDCGVVADACTFISEENKFIIEAKGSLNSARSEFSSDEVKIDAGKAKARYSLEYLQKFIKAAKITDKVIIEFSEDYPLRLDFRVGVIELSFILAPRVETED
jgi:proliferating cell nuclear antigen